MNPATIAKAKTGRGNNAGLLREQELATLRQTDEFITEVIFTASHVVIYEFDEETKAWVKIGIAKRSDVR